MSNFKLTFGKGLKRLRTRANLTQEKLAELINVQYTTICSTEAGRTFPKSENIDRLCKVLNATYLDFFIDEFNSDDSEEYLKKKINSLMNSYDKENLNRLYKITKSLNE